MVYEEGFEGDARPWGTSQDMVATIDDAAAHTGERSMLVSGSHERGWNYAATRVPVPLAPAGKYRLTVWMLVEDIQPGGFPPYMKLAANAADGTWLENYVSRKYDMRRMGTWQKLVAVGEVPLEAAVGIIAIEKGAHDTPIEARIRIDDVRLELLEAP